MKTIAVDIETAAAEELHSFGPGFFRLGAWKTVGSGQRATVTTDPRELIAAMTEADAVTWHNGLNFDALALAKYYGADYEALARKSWDTIVVERHLNPIAAKGAQPRGYYGLDATAERYGVAGKSSVDFEGKREIIRRIRGDKEADRLKRGKENSFPVLKLLAALYGGFHLIPQDDPDYVAYLRMDVDASEAVFLAQRKAVAALSADDQRYIRREHAVTAATGRITLEGFRVDVDETMKRWSAGQARLEAGKQRLHDAYGMPLEGKFPHRTNPGKAAFRSALLGTGISEDALDANWPTGRDGSLLTGKEVLNGMVEVFDRTKPEASELCRIILAMNGERTVYGTIMDHLNGGRVHPYIGPDQSSGRWSMKDPGLTVMGKRGGKFEERAVMLADNDDEVLVAIDADQIDARMIAAMCQDPEYMKLFEPGRDLHSEVAARVFGVDLVNGKVRPDDKVFRERAKVFGHGFNYGMGANGMAKQHGVDIDVARRFVQGMQEAFPRLAEWKEEMRKLAGAVGFDEAVPADDSYRILHTAFGRPVRVERQRAYTQACAQVGQGSTRDAMAEAILKLSSPIRRRVRAVIHDEIVISLPKRGAQEAAQSIADGMAFEVNNVAISFGCSPVGRTWADCYR